MALTGHPFPYDIDNLLGGAVRILYAPADGDTPVAVPTSIADVILMESPYTAQDGWTDLGATRDAFNYTRGFETEGWEIQQVQGAVIEEVTNITRTLEISIADMHPDRLQLIENAPQVETIVAAPGASAQKRIPFGSFSSLRRFRFAFISQRSRQSGLVTESGGAERGRFFMGVAHSAQIAADDVEFEQDKGTLSAANVTFTMFPQPGEAVGEEYGAWFSEDAGSISGSGSGSGGSGSGSGSGG